jgi:hypothetical protein
VQITLNANKVQAGGTIKAFSGCANQQTRLSAGVKSIKEFAENKSKSA